MTSFVRKSALAAGAALLIATGTATASPIQIELNYEFSGAQAPSGSGPWVIGTFSQNGSGVRLTVQSNLSGAGEFISELYFNISNHVSAPSSVDVQFNGALSSAGVSPSSILKKGTNNATTGAGVGQFKADGDGWFDYRVNWNSNVFGGSDVAVFDLSLGSGLQASWFDDFSVGGDKGAYRMAAHVQGVFKPGGDPGNTQGSGYIGDGHVIPLPAAGLMGLAGLGLVGCIRRRC